MRHKWASRKCNISTLNLQLSISTYAIGQGCKLIYWLCLIMQWLMFEMLISVCNFAIPGNCLCTCLLVVSWSHTFRTHPVVFFAIVMIVPVIVISKDQSSSFKMRSLSTVFLKKKSVYDNTAGYWLHNGQIKSHQHDGYGKGGMKMKGIEIHL